MKYLLFFLIFTIKISFGGVHIGNGGGLSELNVAYAWTELPSTLMAIYDSKLMNKSQKTFIKKLMINHINEPNKILFTNSNQYSEIFKNEKLFFFTTSEIGSKIYVNQDFLFKVVNGKKVSLTVSDSIILIIKILNTRYKTDLTNILKNIKIFLDKKSERVDLSVYSHYDIGLEFEKIDTAKIFLTSENNKINITKNIIKQSPCRVLKTFEVSNLIFEDFSSLIDHKVSVLFLGKIHYFCEQKKYIGDFEAVSNLSIQNGNGESPRNWIYLNHLESKVLSYDMDIFNLQIF